MRHYAKITCFKVVLDFPAGWGNAVAAISDGSSLHDLVYDEFVKLLDVEMAKSDTEFCCMEDDTRGWHYSSFAIDIANDGDAERFNRSVDFLLDIMLQAYKMVPSEVRKAAKLAN